MTEAFLIAHKVRGESAFDIAIRLDDEIWIIPTSGHRARPYWHLPLTSIFFKLPDMPSDLRDHYYCNDAKPRVSAAPSMPSLEDLA